MKGVDSMAMPEGSTIYDLVQTGLNYTHAAVGVLVRLRKELSLVKDVPVLFAIDQVGCFRFCAVLFYFIIFIVIIEIFHCCLSLVQ